MVPQAKDGTTALDLAEKELQRYIDLHPDEEPTQKFNDIIDIIDLIKERMSGETRAERLNDISTCWIMLKNIVLNQYNIIKFTIKKTYFNNWLQLDMKFLSKLYFGISQLDV